MSGEALKMLQEAAVEADRNTSFGLEYMRNYVWRCQDELKLSNIQMAQILNSLAIQYSHRALG